MPLTLQWRQGSDAAYRGADPDQIVTLNISDHLGAFHCELSRLPTTAAAARRLVRQLSAEMAAVFRRRALPRVGRLHRRAVRKLRAQARAVATATP